MDHHCPAETLRSGQNDGTRLVLLHWKCLNVYTQAACFVLILTADLLEMVSVMSSVSSPSADRRRQSRITVSCKSLWMTSGNALSTKYLFTTHTHKLNHLHNQCHAVVAQSSFYELTKSLWSVQFLYFYIASQGCIKLIRCNSKDIYNVTKKSISNECCF